MIGRSERPASEVARDIVARAGWAGPIEYFEIPAGCDLQQSAEDNGLTCETRRTVHNELLQLRKEERARLLERVRVATDRQSCVHAAWLFGSHARGNTDALSDLDLSVVVSDDAMSTVAGDPSRPVDYRQVLASPRGRWVAQVVEPPLLLLEAPQNAPPGGAALTSFFAGEAGPQQVDWQWLPLSTARRPRESLLLFDRAGMPYEASPSEVGPGPAPDRTPFEVAAHAVPWFWATLIWNAKHAARSPRDTEMPMLGQTVRAVFDVEQFLDPDAGPPTGEPTIEYPEDRLRILRDLSDRMERLMPRARALSAGMPPDLVPQARRFLQLTEEIMLQHIV